MANYADSPQQRIERGERAEAILRKLATTKHADLPGHVYAIRDRELKGWDGPAVVQWGEACMELAEFLDEFPAVSQ